MKTPRLIPTLIVAASALLVFKTVGIVTGGGYTLVGTGTAIAAGGGGGGEHAAPAADVGGGLDGPVLSEHTLEDTSPTLGDTDETLSLGEPAAAHGNTTEHGEAADAGAAETHDAAPAGEVSSETAVDAAAATLLPACPPEAEATAGADGTGDHGAASATAPADCLPVADSGAPVIRDGSGAVIPLVDSAVGVSQGLLVERLGERREELDARQAELDMRLALVEAAEQRLDERTTELKALEARINTMVDQQKAAEEAQFKALVAMYEAMKPKEAALIFDQLEISVLTRVAQAMSPKKMGPVMAKMDPAKAKTLTSVLVAAELPRPQLADAPAPSGELPQIVGQ